MRDGESSIASKGSGRSRRPKIHPTGRWYGCIVGARARYGMRRCSGQNLGGAHREGDADSQCKRTFATLMHTPPLSFCPCDFGHPTRTNRSRQSAFKNQSPLKSNSGNGIPDQRPGRPAAPPMSKAITLPTTLATQQPSSPFGPQARRTAISFAPGRCPT